MIWRTSKRLLCDMGCLGVAGVGVAMGADFTTENR